MPRVTFTQNLQRHVEVPSMDVGGATVAEALEEVFTAIPRTRSYVVDEGGALRQHMVVFVDGVQIHDRVRLSDPVDATAEIYVMQALSGG